MFAQVACDDTECMEHIINTVIVAIYVDVSFPCGELDSLAGRNKVSAFVKIGVPVAHQRDASTEQFAVKATDLMFRCRLEVNIVAFGALVGVQNKATVAESAK